MKLTKGKPWKTAAKIVAYLLEIAGTREDAERAADKWKVRIQFLGETPGENEVYAVCPAEDVWEIMVWHDDYAPRLWAGGQPIPGDLMRIEQPPAEVDTSFTEEKKKDSRCGVAPRSVVQGIGKWQTSRNQRLGVTDTTGYKVGKLLDTETSLRPECPHCLYNGGDDPKTGSYPFLLFEDVVTSRALRMDRAGDPLSLDESDFASDYQDAQNPRFLCGECEGKFVLSTRDFERLIESGVGY